MFMSVYNGVCVNVKPIGVLGPTSYNDNNSYYTTYEGTPTFLYFCQGNLTDTN